MTLPYSAVRQVGRGCCPHLTNDSDRGRPTTKLNRAHPLRYLVELSNAAVAFCDKQRPREPATRLNIRHRADGTAIAIVNSESAHFSFVSTRIY